MAARIEDYGFIGDFHSAALVARDGSVDWLCWPRFDAPALFAALLGTAENGRWRIAPAGPGADAARITRRYRPGTLILETDFELPEGAVTVIDFMPPRTTVPDLIRIVVGRRGRVEMGTELILRFDYGSTVPWVSKLPDGGGLRAVAGPDMVTLRTPVALRGVNLHTEGRFAVAEGERVPFVLSHTASHLEPPPPVDAFTCLEQTEAVWRGWSRVCNVSGPFAEPVVQSLCVLKGLTYAPTGGIVAAATTSLPEQAGGVRNWDYRYCWARDATLSLMALMHAGYYDEARAWGEWLLRAAAGDPAQVQIMYGLGGERRLVEWEADWLPGYEGARPVRIGNAASGQRQLDIYGEIMDALHQARRGQIVADDTAWQLQVALTRHLETIWALPDEGIWEVRGGRLPFTFSKMMAWVALDRAVKAVEQSGLPGPVERWRAVRAAIHADVCAHGYDPARGAFTQSYGRPHLDASLLLMPLTGFLPADDPRVRGTVAAIERELMVDGLVRRYDTDRVADGLPPGEGVFVACSFWLADNLVLQNRGAEARALFDRLLLLRNDLGLLAEEYDPVARRQMGNFPQAFSHVALVNTALNLSRATSPATERGRPEKP